MFLVFAPCPRAQILDSEGSGNFFLRLASDIHDFVEMSGILLVGSVNADIILKISMVEFVFHPNDF
jgi:hypothetical protein